MKTIKCDFKTQDIDEDSDLYKILLVGGQPAKFWGLYGCCHLTNQYFKPICLTLIDDPIETISHLRNYVESVQGTYCNTLKDSTNFSINNWDYFNPNIRRKVKLVFKEGSNIKSMVIK